MIILSKNSRAIELDRSDAFGYYGRGLAYYKKHEYALAIADYNRAIERKHDYTLAYCYRGLACLHLQRWPEARESFTIARYIGMDIIPEFRHRQTALQIFSKTIFICQKISKQC